MKSKEEIKMSDHFNQLSPAEAERLAILAEECGEVVQIVGKILRHGYESYSPLDPHEKPNRRLLEKELGDVLWIIVRMDESADINFSLNLSNAGVLARVRRKAISAGPYLHHQPVPQL
jgi:NTP pyrophosphatase (non-canonical NTP hydrolase)